MSTPETIDHFTVSVGNELHPLLTERAQLQGQHVHSYLSNFYRCRIKFEGEIYESVEHAYQAAKFMQPEARERIRVAKSPGAAKRAAVHMSRANHKRTDWLDCSLAVMGVLLVQKFTLYEEFRLRLLETGDRELIEGNNWNDTFFGCVWVEGRWRGENHLGNSLMGVRELMSRVAGSRVPLGA